MKEKDIFMHYVCTKSEAENLIKKQKKFGMTICRCRKAKGACKRSRKDVCLYFIEDSSNKKYSPKEISPAAAKDILNEAREKHLVSRPFRDEKTLSRTTGICFCCDDCCWYFLYGNEECNKGKFMEKTDMKKCASCGACVKFCYFKARELKNKKLKVNQDKCYGCGICAEICPEKSVKMTKRS